MIKKTLRILGVSVVAIGLAACSGDDVGRGSTPTTYSVGGTVTYLATAHRDTIPGTILLKNNAADTLTINNADQTFTFTKKLANGSSYAVAVESYTVEGSTTGWGCKVISGGSGVIKGANVKDVNVTCGRDVKLNNFGAHITDKGVVTLLYQAEDSQGRALSGLQQEDFLVEQDSLPIATGESFKAIVPNTDLSYEIKTVLMIDISSSIDAIELGQVRKAAKGLVVDVSNNSVLLPGQQVAVWVFDGDVTQIQDFTDDHMLLAAKIDSISQFNRPNINSTNLYGAVIAGVNQWSDQFTSNAIKQGFLVLITDGDDTSNLYTLATAKMERGSKNVYTLSVGTGISQAGQNALLELGNAGYLTATSFDLLATKLQEAAQDLADQVNSFYYLHYATPARSGVHTVDLSVEDNVYVGAGYTLSGQFTAYSTFGVQAEIVLNDTAINVAPGQALDVKARVLWDNAVGYDFAWSTASPTATVSENFIDDASALVIGGASAASNTLTVSSYDAFSNPITVSVPLQVTEVSLTAPSKILTLNESISLTAHSNSGLPSFSWSVNGNCWLSASTGTTVTLTAPAYDTTCRLSVADGAGSNVPYITYFTVGAPGTTPIAVSSNADGIYYVSASSYDFESGFMPSGITMSGSADWVIDTTTGSNGTSISARAGSITNSQQSRMTTTVEGVSQISFWYKVDSEPTYDDFIFYVDDVPVLEMAGSVPWTYYTYTLPDTGVHTLTWEYEKDSVYSAGADTAWVDEITLQ